MITLVLCLNYLCFIGHRFVFILHICLPADVVLFVIGRMPTAELSSVFGKLLFVFLVVGAHVCSPTIFFLASCLPCSNFSLMLHIPLNAAFLAFTSRRAFIFVEIINTFILSALAARPNHVDATLNKRIFHCQQDGCRIILPLHFYSFL